MKRSKVVFDEKKPYKCELCGEWVEKYKETNLCGDCGNEVIKMKNKDKVDNLTKFASLCVNIGSFMLFTGLFARIWVDSDFVQRYALTGLYLFVTASIIYAIEALAKDCEQNKGQVRKW